MDRKEFLSKFGFGGMMALTSICLASCIKHEALDPPDHIKNANFKLPGPENPDITIDLNQPEYANLKWPGGWVLIQESIVVAKTEDSEEFVAASRICSDEILPGVIFAGNEWYCTEHDATFDVTGKGTQTFNDRGFRGLRVYKTELTDNLLRIYA
ncbi:MAG: hypothetical protein H6608_12210 [Flavobacteriales bacterium]|nr:hypothetical protein [Flavobacteriales bacterium]